MQVHSKTCSPRISYLSWGVQGPSIRILTALGENGQWWMTSSSKLHWRALTSIILIELIRPEGHSIFVLLEHFLKHACSSMGTQIYPKSLTLSGKTKFTSYWDPFWPQRWNSYCIHNNCRCQVITLQSLGSTHLQYCRCSGEETLKSSSTIVLAKASYLLQYLYCLFDTSS